MALVHGLWIEHRVASTITIDEVIGVFHGMIDDATGQLWRMNMRGAPRRQTPDGSGARGNQSASGR
ncbi:hypothetical protein, partial [Escherichia coli]